MAYLSRDFDERKALVRGLINALVRNHSIETTLQKAQAIKGVVDKLITQAKKGDLHNRRLVQEFLDDEDNTNKMLNELAPVFKGRSGGYLRIIRLGARKGDNAMIVRVEFSDTVVKKAGKKQKLEKKQKVEDVKTDVKKTKSPKKPNKNDKK